MLLSSGADAGVMGGARWTQTRAASPTGYKGALPGDVSVGSASLQLAVAVMETGVSSDPEAVEVLPQHKFDYRSLEAYLDQHLPGFGTEPRAKLTVAQYRYLRQPSSFGPEWVPNSPHPSFFTCNDALCRREPISPVPCIIFGVSTVRGQS